MKFWGCKLFGFLFVSLILCISSSVATAQQVSRKKPPTTLVADTAMTANLVTADIERTLKIVERLRLFCVKPKDAFESETEARRRMMTGFESPEIRFMLRPLLVADDDNSSLTVRRWGGRMRGAVKYDHGKQQLQVNFPYELEPIQRNSPFDAVTARQPKFALLRFAEQGNDLGVYDASNAYGVSAKVSWNRETYWHLFYYLPKDVARLRPSEYIKNSGVPTHTISLAPNDARALVSALVWEVRSRVEPVGDAKCVIEVQDAIFRSPTIDNPWLQERRDIYVPVMLDSLRLVDSRDNTVLWESSGSP